MKTADIYDNGIKNRYELGSDGVESIEIIILVGLPTLVIGFIDGSHTQFINTTFSVNSTDDKK